MKHIVTSSEVLGVVESPDGANEVCVDAQADFDEDTSRLSVALDSFLRPVGLLVKERHFHADWLPAREVVTEHVSREESGEVARGIFQRWVRKVRLASPRLHAA